MIFNIEHKTTYRYSGDVQLDPHLIRLTPRENQQQRVLRHEVFIDPEPQGRSWLIDTEGNQVLNVWFSGRTRRLTIKNVCTVATLCENPYDYLVTRENRQMPPLFRPEEQESLRPYLARPSFSSAVDAFGFDLLDQSQGMPVKFLSLLNETLYSDFRNVLRDEGDPYDPDFCLKMKSGACRDLAVLFMDVCRSVGLPARFVSGYQEGDIDMTHRHLHAWPEVYMPGAGWRGYDPTLGLAVSDRHVPLAASFQPKGANPIEGTFWGAAIESQMDYDLKFLEGVDVRTA
jgi:transglutaminase-like putative cysteine protease